MRLKLTLILVIGFAIIGYFALSVNSPLENQATTTCCSNELEATCVGADPCRACKNCKYCKRCSKDGLSCGVCD